MTAPAVGRPWPAGSVAVNGRSNSMSPSLDGPYSRAPGPGAPARSSRVQPPAPTVCDGCQGGAAGTDAQEVVESTDEHRGRSVAEQLIRKQPQAPPAKTQHDVNPGNQTEPP
jgi:hypothetical protein